MTWPFLGKVSSLQEKQGHEWKMKIYTTVLGMLKGSSE